MKILAVVGARPNFVKIAPLAWQARLRKHVDFTLVHTGQHYDDRLSAVFFKELDIPQPDFDLGVGSGSHAAQTAEVMKRFEPVLLDQSPDLVLVVGDVNSTLACAITAAKLQVPVGHVEAGLRSFDQQMPEEINRMLTDRISRWLFVTEPSGVANLLREGTPADRIHHVGNVMIDTLLACQDRFARSEVLARLQVRPGEYGLLTLHRPSNVDDRSTLRCLLDAIGAIGGDLPVIFPIHPRTAAKLQDAGFSAAFVPGLRLIEPLGYFDFLALEASARLVLTDSGGVQEETTALGVPCLTIRCNTERPITVTQGTNRLVGTDPSAIVEAARAVTAAKLTRNGRPELWDGRAASRIFDVLLAMRPIAAATVKRPIRPVRREPSRRPRNRPCPLAAGVPTQLVPIASKQRVSRQTTSDPATAGQEDAAVLPDRLLLRVLRWLLACATWGLFAAALVQWILIRWLGDVWWMGTVVLFAPRWPLLIPLAGVAALCLVWQRRLLRVNLATALVLLGLVMGFCVPTSFGGIGKNEFSLRVLTANTGDGVNAAKLQEQIEAAAPDVIAFQESTSRVIDLLAESGWHWKTARGLVVGSRFPIVESEVFAGSLVGRYHDNGLRSPPHAGRRRLDLLRLPGQPTGWIRVADGHAARHFWRRGNPQEQPAP